MPGLFPVLATKSVFWKRDGNGRASGRWPTYSDRVTTGTNGRKRGTKHHPSAPILPGGPVGNTSRLTHGLYSRRRLPLSKPELEEVEALLEMPHVIPPDCLAAEEIVRLRSLIKRIDRHLTDNQVENGVGRGAHADRVPAQAVGRASGVAAGLRPDPQVAGGLRAGDGRRRPGGSAAPDQGGAGEGVTSATFAPSWRR